MNAWSKPANWDVASTDSLDDILQFARMLTESAKKELVAGQYDSEPAFRGIF